MAETRFPHVQKLLVLALEGLAGGAEHTGTETPDDLQDRLPFVRVRRVTGDSTWLNDRPVVEVDVFAATQDVAWRLAEDIRDYLVGPPPPLPLLDRIDCEQGPRELPWADGRVRRWGADYRVTSRRRAVTI